MVLQQVLALKEMLSRGIGVHHGGLLPILKVSLEKLHAINNELPVSTINITNRLSAMSDCGASICRSDRIYWEGQKKSKQSSDDSEPQILLYT